MLWDPKKIHIEITNACVAKCPFCIRTENGGVKSHQELSIGDIKKFFTPEVMESLNSITICGTYGDPIYAKDFIEIIEYFCSFGVHIHVSTNGYNNKKNFWNRLGNTSVDITFGIDGITQKSHARYRVGTDLKQILRNVTEFIGAGGHASWQFLVFDYNEHQIESARSVSKQMGFKDFIVRKSRRYDKTHGKPKYIFHKEGDYLGGSILCDFKKDERWYINALGQVLPCCYLSDLQFEDSQLLDKSMNIKFKSLEEIKYKALWEHKIGHFYSNKNGKNICKVLCSVKNKTERKSLETNEEN